MLCKDAEYKNMDQDMSLGQLYDVQNEIKILHKAKVGSAHWRSLDALFWSSSYFTTHHLALVPQSGA